MSLVSGYKDVPVSNRIGIGSYTYKCVLDTQETGVVKIEVFANNVELAMQCIATQFGTIVDFKYVSKDIISLILAPYRTGTCVLYME
jgi:hypothetical protein